MIVHHYNDEVVDYRRSQITKVYGTAIQGQDELADAKDTLRKSATPKRDAEENRADFLERHLKTPLHLTQVPEA